MSEPTKTLTLTEVASLARRALSGCNSLYPGAGPDIEHRILERYDNMPGHELAGVIEPRIENIFRDLIHPSRHTYFMRPVFLYLLNEPRGRRLFDFYKEAY